MRRFALAGTIAVALGAAIFPQAYAASSTDIRGVAQAAARAPTPELLVRAENEHPIVALLLAQRLWDEHDRDAAVFWFEVGHLRWRTLLRSRGNPYEQEQFLQLKQIIGDEVRFYAACDVPKLQGVFRRVLDWDASHPDPPFVKRRIKAEERKAIESMSSQLGEQAGQIAASRQGNAKCSPAGPLPGNDPYPGEGGSYFGTPDVLLQDYDPERAAMLTPGVSTKAEVARQLGRPEVWSTEPDGASSMSYSYRAKEAVLPGLHQVVRQTFSFDANKRLTGVTQPGEP